ncbi:hypothetical protein [Fodinibius salsisoli]|uniref:Uncharacterized protein n=1 Tax=Fodinibius salsisoli TaxID=2820877 RepID=A0ABT3PKQ2_9BACT|nr:hypothetical protein [Fodinibius salsisoli]MCW9705789.1 hypothetical protein [Fodinibius salsisoli]
MIRILPYITVFISCIAIPLSANGQSYIYWGNKNYPSTYLGTFEGEVKSIVLKIGKRGSGDGVILVETKYKNAGSFNGSIYLFLSNGERIKCIDRNLTDTVNQKNRALYFLTKQEVETLKRNNIIKIRFSLKGTLNSSGDFTVENISSFGLDKFRFETSEDFIELFGPPAND